MSNSNVKCRYVVSQNGLQRMNSRQLRGQTEKKIFQIYIITTAGEFVSCYGFMLKYAVMYMLFRRNHKYLCSFNWYQLWHYDSRRSNNKRYVRSYWQIPFACGVLTGSASVNTACRHHIVWRAVVILTLFVFWHFVCAVVGWNDDWKKSLYRCYTVCYYVTFCSMKLCYIYIYIYIYI